MAGANLRFMARAVSINWALWSLSLSPKQQPIKKKRPANKQPKQDRTPAVILSACFLYLLYSAVGGRPTTPQPDAGPAETPTTSGVGTRWRRRPMAGSRRPRPPPEGRHDHEPDQPDRNAGLPQGGRHHTAIGGAWVGAVVPREGRAKAWRGAPRSGRTSHARARRKAADAAGERGNWAVCKQPIVISATLGTPTGRAQRGRAAWGFTPHGRVGIARILGWYCEDPGLVLAWWLWW